MKAKVNSYVEAAVACVCFICKSCGNCFPLVFLMDLVLVPKVTCERDNDCSHH